MRPQPIMDRCARFACRVIAVALFVVPAASAQAATGLDWLAGQQNADGSYGGTPASLATPVQSTAAVLRAYQALGLGAGASHSTGLAFLGSDPEINTEFLARKIIAGAQAGGDVSAWLATLLTHQNPDGGFGDQAGYDSSVLDTAFALEALAVAGYANAEVIARAIFYLAQQQANGGFRLSAANDGSVHLTALAMTALQRYAFHYNLAGQLDKARAFLLSRQSAVGGWADDTETALALTAIVPFTSDTSLYAASLGALRAGQRADGSWLGDSYTTALALRALQLAENTAPPPVMPTTGSFTGRVVNDATGVPLVGAFVAIDQP
ncbi:MAG TPA: prenyltransferase/squalene oxidase repeat-containing protein, partial [Acidiferrobacterales bacterium]